jgi:hypothetical protein
MYENYFGGADRDRTGGLLVANEALSQLSYSPTCERYIDFNMWNSASSFAEEARRVVTPMRAVGLQTSRLRRPQ